MKTKELEKGKRANNKSYGNTIKQKIYVLLEAKTMDEVT